MSRIKTSVLESRVVSSSKGCTCGPNLSKFTLDIPDDFSRHREQESQCLLLGRGYDDRFTKPENSPQGVRRSQLELMATLHGPHDE
jgi:hypothetical protein